MTRNSLIARLLAAALTFGVCLPATTAFADEEAAAEYYQQATEAYQEGDLRKAAELLDKAFGQHPDLVYKYNRILALQGLGEYELALQELNTMYAPMKADAQNRFDDIDEIKAQLEGQITKENKDTEPEQTGGESGGETTDTASTTTVDTTTTTTTPTEKGPNIPAYALLGVGGASLVAGTLFITGVLVPADAARCYGISEPTGCSGDFDPAFYSDASNPQAAAYADAESVVRTHQILAVTFLSAGVLAAGAGAILLVLDGSGSGGEADVPPSAGLDSLRLSPYVAGDGAGATLQMRF